MWKTIKFDGSILHGKIFHGKKKHRVVVFEIMENEKISLLQVVPLKIMQLNTTNDGNHQILKQIAQFKSKIL